HDFRRVAAMSVVNYLKDVLGIENVVCPTECYRASGGSFKDVRRQLVAISDDKLSNAESELLKKMLAAAQIHDYGHEIFGDDLGDRLLASGSYFLLYFGVKSLPELPGVKVFALEPLKNYLTGSGDELKKRKSLAWELLKKMKHEIKAWEE